MNETHTDVRSSLVDKIYNMCSDDLHFARPISNLRANEADLVQGVLKMLQGFSSPLFYWDQNKKAFCTKPGIYVSHLSRTSLYAILNQFSYAATCLQLVDLVVDKVKSSSAMAPPTLRAFACSVSSWTKRLRDIALEEEMKIGSSHNETTLTLLGLASSLSSLCSGAEHLLEIVHRSIPPECFQPNPAITAAEMAVHILDYLYQRLDEACLVQGGEEEAYQMLLYLFTGSIIPYVECLDSWLYEGTLDDPFEEMFFYANKEISLEDAEFWEKSYLLRLVQQREVDTQQTILSASRDLVSLIGDKKEPSERDSNSILSSLRGKEWAEKSRPLCPLFIKDIAKSIVSAGKSLQLTRHVPSTPLTKSFIGNNKKVDAFHGQSKDSFRHGAGGSSLAEIFCVSLAGLLGHGDHLSRWFKFKHGHDLETQENKSSFEKGDSKSLHAKSCSGKIWWKFLADTFSDKGEGFFEPADANNSFHVEQGGMASKTLDPMSLLKSCPENPAVAVCNASLMLNVDDWRSLNISSNSNLPPLNDEVLWNAIFSEDVGLVSKRHGTDFTFGFQFSELENLRQQVDRKLLQGLFPFPTLLPSFEEEIQVSQLLPFQKNSTLPSKVLRWIQHVEPRTTPFPLAIMQECLVVYIERQVDMVGKQILLKLMHDWRLMDELAVLRAIYLLGSGDLLQHFLTVLFNKLDREEAWDDDFELNTILQESIRNSADGNLLNSPDSLVVSIVRSVDCNVDEQNNMPASTPRKSVGQSYGIDGLDSLKFTYKVSWPLELVANMETIKKYNQVMVFLLKVKRAKFVLDKTRRWMWKGKGTATYCHKYHWLVEQKLLHFVDAFHQYVMDRVYHNSWRELCEGAASAASLDEVMEVHEAYLMSIQRQCFVVPDKLWALISYRINIILGLALDFYSVQQTLSSGGAVPAVKARCDMKVEQIEKQFDDCIAFLLRVLSFKLNVGNFPHLADLVTRINYNYFYMSDSGSLKPTASVENASSRLGKPFPGRTNRM